MCACKQTFQSNKTEMEMEMKLKFNQSSEKETPTDLITACCMHDPFHTMHATWRIVHTSTMVAVYNLRRMSRIIISERINKAHDGTWHILSWRVRWCDELDWHGARALGEV